MIHISSSPVSRLLVFPRDSGVTTCSPSRPGSLHLRLTSPHGPPQKLALTMSTIEVAGSSSTNARANDQGLFQCGSCKRHYNRLDHLARHVRSRKIRTANVTWRGRESDKLVTGQIPTLNRTAVPFAASHSRGRRQLSVLPGPNSRPNPRPRRRRGPLGIRDC